MLINGIKIWFDGGDLSERVLRKANMFVNVYGCRVRALGKERVCGVPVLGPYLNWKFGAYECALAEFIGVVEFGSAYEHLAHRVRVALTGVSHVGPVDIEVPVVLTNYLTDRRAQS
jgi:hypothetical protein